MLARAHNRIIYQLRGRGKLFRQSFFIGEETFPAPLASLAALTRRRRGAAAAAEAGPIALTLSLRLIERLQASKEEEPQ